uniref:Oxygen sensor histidine kinase NreB n=1 Tax=Streptomyces sp. NBC_01401 TaxID=2903854 RepID=A0AAU3GYV5_9ACTN
MADLIEERASEIIEAYQAELRSSGNAVAGGEISLEQALTNGRHIIADVVNSLRVGRIQIDKRYKLLAWGIGTTRAADGVHPRESVQASSVFFHTALSAMFGFLIPEPEALETFAFITMALERSITLRIREAVAGYTGLLLNKVHEAQIGERRRIARELHDRVGHSMSVSHRQLELYTLYQETQPDRASLKLATAQQAIQESMHSLRAVTSDLHAYEPLRCLERALINDLESVASDEVSVQFRLNGDEAWAPPEVLDEVFLIIREGIRNTLCHAKASVLFVEVEITPDELRASVEDNGCGIPVERGLNAGVGLFSMHERAELLNGSLLINSHIGSGTRVNLSVPLEMTAPR